MNKKNYELFYNKYKKKLYEQYPSAAKAQLNTPPASPFLIPLTQNTINKIHSLVKVFYKMAHWKSHIQNIQTKNTSYLNASVADSSLLMSYDFHLDQAGELRLIEINTHSSGYLVSDLVDQVQGVDQGNQVNHKKRSSVYDTSALSHLKNSFEEEWKHFSGKNQPSPEILITDHEIKQQKMYIEFLMYQDLLSQWGWPCRLHEIKEFNTDSQGMLVDSRQKKVQMIYNRCTDFYFESLPHLKQAFLTKKCCITPHPREYLLLADKARFCEWSSSDFLNKLGLSPEEEKQIKNVVPFTAFINSVSKEELWKRRKTLFFKPLKGHGGKAVYRGKNITHNMFERIINNPGIFQNAVPPPVFTDPSGVKWKYDIRAYAYKDQVQKLSARIYQGQLTQFQVPLSGFASVIIQ